MWRARELAIRLQTPFPHSLGPSCSFADTRELASPCSCPLFLPYSSLYHSKSVCERAYTHVCLFNKNKLQAPHVPPPHSSTSYLSSSSSYPSSSFTPSHEALSFRIWGSGRALAAIEARVPFKRCRIHFGSVFHWEGGREGGREGGKEGGKGGGKRERRGEAGRGGERQRVSERETICARVHDIIQMTNLLECMIHNFFS